MPCQIYVFGDSHVGPIRYGANKLGYRVGGRGVTRGRVFFNNTYTLTETSFSSPEDLEAGKRFKRGLKLAGVRSLAKLAGTPCITTLGFQLDMQLRLIDRNFTLDPNEDSRKHKLSEDAFKAAILSSREHLFAHLKWFQSLGMPVTVIAPPPRQTPVAMAIAAENAIAARLSELGANVHLPRSWAVGEDNLLRPEYLPPRADDFAHANALYGEHLAERVMPSFNMTPLGPTLWRRIKRFVYAAVNPAAREAMRDKKSAV